MKKIDLTKPKTKWLVNGKRLDQLNTEEKENLNSFISEAKAEDLTPNKDISDELFKEWRASVRYGDVNRLMKHTGLSQPVITRALNNGIIKKHKAVVMITDFFHDRLKKEMEEAKRLKEVRELNEKTLCQK